MVNEDNTKYFEAQTCPRRVESFGPTSKNEMLDFWKKGTSFADHEADLRLHSCSYCGSIHPDDFMGYIRRGWTLVPTDKSYKAYLGEPIDPPEVLPIQDITIDHRDAGKFYYQHLSPAQRDEFIALVNSHSIKMGYPGYLYTTPYFCHVVKATS